MQKGPADVMPVGSACVHKGPDDAHDAVHVCPADAHDAGLMALRPTAGARDAFWLWHVCRRGQLMLMKLWTCVQLMLMMLASLLEPGHVPITVIKFDFF